MDTSVSLPDVDARRLLADASGALLAERVEDHWEGHLSSSALATATAVTALALHARAREGAPDDAARVGRGLQWLAAHQNADGGWGDTTSSRSNISTTLLAWSALAFAPRNDAAAREAVRRAEAWITGAAGGLDAPRLAAAVTARYGRDRTFSAPILTTCALAGRLGGAAAWRHVPALPFELAAAPRAWFGALRLPVVSYALPALIAIGLVRHRRRPSRNPLVRLVRSAATTHVLKTLDALQPRNGGFLEATPLTSFVAMSLVGAGEVGHPAVPRALAFIRQSARADGSWPVDTHLATWVTTLAVNALHAAGQLASMPASDLAAIRQWLVAQQHSHEHVYTGAAPGGWAWTPLPGGVPDADDTAGAILALAALPGSGAAGGAAAAGIEWLLRLQNRDGGIPTFCRGWGALPFDRSGADLTAHALRAWDAWLDRLSADLQGRVRHAMDRAVGYLRSSQRADGAFVPLWFGNEAAPDEENPTYGTARVLTALASMARRRGGGADGSMAAAVRWLLAAQHADGGWGGDCGVPATTEETALAVGALCEYGLATADIATVSAAVIRGCRWLAASAGSRREPAPIGLYFARLWYSERLYPLVSAVEAFGRAADVLQRSG